MKTLPVISSFAIFLVAAAQAQLFSDSFNRTTLPPWIGWSGSWQVTGGAMRGGTNGAMTYGFAYITNRFADVSVQAQFQFPAGAYGGGLGGRLDTASGSHYAAWIYPENSAGGFSALKLLRFDDYSRFVVLQQTSLAAVGTNFHTVKVEFSGDRISVYLNGDLKLSANDATYGSGSVSLDMWTDATGYQMRVDDVVVSALPLVANADNYGAVAGSPLIVGAPGVLANDSGGNGSLSAVPGVNAEHGTLTLNSNGSFTYNPDSDFTGADMFTYWATDGANSSTPATVTISVSAMVPLYSDNFSRMNLWPWVAQSGNWEIANGRLRGGTNALLSYGLIYMTNQWSNYSVQASVQLPPGAFGAGLDACLDPKTGARYAAWIYPGAGAGGAGMIKLLKFQNWTEWRLMQQATLPGAATNAHTLKLACAGNRIVAWFDGALTISLSDNEAQPYLGGAIGVDFWTDTAGYEISVDDVLVASLVNDDSYNLIQDSTLTVPAPGLLANDTAVYGPSLTAALVSSPTDGALSLSADGGFTYTPNTGFIGTNTFTYQVSDGPVNLGTATVMIKVTVDGSGTLVFSEHFDGVTAPALPSGWSTEASGAQVPWVTRTAVRDTLPNSAYVADPNGAGLSDLVSPSIPLPAGKAQLKFRNNYRLESDRQNPTNGFDGGVLEIKIGTGSFADILAAGGSFVSGGYNRVIDARYTSALAGRKAWSGTNAGFVTTLVNLPVAAAGQSVQLRWRCGTDSSGNGGGWYVDTVAITNFGLKLPVQADRSMAELTTLTVVNTASAPDSPPGSLTYLLTAAPDNAVISSDGVITWTPSEAQGPGSHIFATVVSDNATPPATATNSFTVTVDELNSVPVLTLPAEQTITELVPWNGSANATDSDEPSNVLAFELVSGPAGLTISSGGLIIWTPTEAQGPATNIVSVRVFDNGVPSLSATNTFFLTVGEVNAAPVLALPGDQTVGELMAWNANATATDADSPPNALTFELVSGPTGLTVSPGGAIGWTPSEAYGSTVNTVTVRVVDNGTPSLGATSSFALTVQEGNSAPVLTLPVNQNISELVAWSSNATATDADVPLNALTYELVSGPAGLTVYSTGLIRWTPTEAQGPTTNFVTVRVSDDGMPSFSATNCFVLTVGEVNSAPVLTLPGSQTISELAPWSSNATATDADSPPNALTFELVSGPSGMTVSSGGEIHWTPTEAQGSTTNIVAVRVFDNGVPSLSVTNSIVLTVNEVNSAPVLAMPGSQTISELAPWSSNATATDADSPPNVLTFELVSGPIGLTVSPGGLINWTPAEGQGPTTYIVSVRVYDNGAPSLSATNHFILTVAEVNSAPVATLPAGQATSELAGWSANATAIDTDVPPNAFTFELVSGPVGLVVGPSGFISWTPAEDQGPSTNIVTVRVYDNGTPSLSVTNNFTVTVFEVNRAPTLMLPPDRTLSKLAPWSVYATATDPDVPQNALTFELVSAPDGLTVSPSGLISWTPEEWQGPSTNNVIVRVVDDGAPGLSATNSFSLVVDKVNTTPLLTLPADPTSSELVAWSANAIAEDNDTPPDILVFELVSGPIGLSVRADGFMSWTPSEAQGPSTNIVKVRVFDNGATSLSATNSFTITVDEVNTTPLLPAQSDRTILELTALTVTNTVADSDVPANTLVYALLAAPAGATISADGVIAWTPSEAQGPGTNIFITQALDNGLPPLGVTNTFSVVVGESNSAPVLAAQTGRTIPELTKLTVVNTATDSDHPANTLTYTLVQAPAGATVSANGLVTWTPGEAQGPSTNTFITRALDDGLPPVSVSNAFTVVVTEVNSAPGMPAQPDRTIPELTTLTVINKATDSDLPANTLVYTLLAAPGGAMISAEGVITWTPSEAQGPSTNTFVTQVTDNGVPSRSAINSFSVVVEESNSAPVLTAQVDWRIQEFTTLIVTNIATDADLPAQTLTYALVAAPDGATVSAGGVITWTPNEAQGPGTNTIITWAVDGGLPPRSVTNTFRVVVDEMNATPVLPDPIDRTVLELTTLIVTNTATDTDLPANTLTYALLAAPAGATISADGVITWTPSEAQGPGTNLFITQVADNGVPPGSVIETFSVVVNEANSAPVLPVQTDRTILELAPLTVVNTATDSDFPANSLMYALLAAPSGAAISADGVISWVPAETQGPSTNNFVTQVTDNGVPPRSVMNNFRVVVAEANNPPLLPAQADRTILELTTLIVTNTSTDPDIPTQTLTYTLVTAPAGATISADGVIVWTPGEAQGPGTNTFITLVADDGLPPRNATNNFTVVVNEANSAPVLPVHTDHAIQEMTTLTVVNTATDSDIPANTLTYTLLAAPPGASMLANGVITWTPSEAQGPGTNAFTIQAMDDGIPSRSAISSFTVVVNEANRAPVLQEQVDRSIVAGTTLMVTNTATDQDVPANVVIYSRLGGPANVDLDMFTGLITWTPTEAQIGSTNSITTVATDYNPWVIDAQHLSVTNTFTVVVLSGPKIALGETVLASESNMPINNAIDPGEMVTMLFSLKNVGGVDTTNLVVTLLQTNGVLACCEPQSYGTVRAGGPGVNRPFTFLVSGTCGSTITPTLQMRDGSASYGLVTAPFTVGLPGTISTQNFDAVSVPALPEGWTTSASGAQKPWFTTNSLADTTPNAVFSASTNKIGLSELVSPPLILPTVQAQLSFRNRYELEYDSVNSNVGYDGGVLEIKIGTNSFSDILAVGGSFLSGGYNRVISTGYSSPLAKRAAWSGISAGYVTTLVNLPTEAAGQMIQLRWVCGTDSGGTSRSGWRIDNIGLSGWVCGGTNVPPMIQMVTFSNDVVTVTWSAVADRAYRLQYKGALNDTNWDDCPLDVIATGPTATATDTVGNATQRFYRIYLLP